MNINQNKINANSIVRGSIFPEPVQVILITSIGNSTKLIGKGLTSGKVYEPVLTDDQINQLSVSSEKYTFDGNSERFQLGCRGDTVGIGL
jgi:hypothetical protein